MRHNVYGKKLSRDKNQRTALFKSLVRSLIISETIETTQAKAQAIKGLVDKLVNQAKSPDTRRFVSQFLTDKAIAQKLVNDLAPRLSNRNSGYTSVVKLGFRQGDGAMVVKMSLLTEAKPATKQASKTKETVSAETIEVDTKVAQPKKRSTKKEAKA